MPTDVGTALALVNQGLGIKDKESRFRINVARLIQLKRLVVLTHNLFKKRVRLIQPLRMRLIQVTSNYFSFWHGRIIVRLDSNGLSQARVF
jgi:hypothetical protein